MFISGTYKRFSISIRNAKGIWVYDKNGKKYLDTFSGIGVNIFGHCDKDITSAIIEKAKRFTHISNFFLDEDASIIAEKLVKKTNKEGKVYFSNSGTEANEAALKTIKKYKNGIIVSFTGNFHGRTIGSLSITGFENLREPFLPLLDNIVFLRYNDIEMFKNFFKENGENVSAVFVESVRGSGGLDKLDIEFANLIMEYKHKYGFILVADEVQSGLGRTGKFFAYQHFNLEPDIVTTAKALGGGIPLGATIFIGKLQNIFSLGDHGSTFAPNPLALSASKVVLNKIDKNLLDEVTKKGIYLKDNLLSIDNPKILEVKGLGLMIGIKVDTNKDITKIALKEEILLNVVKKNVIRLLPPLNISYQEINLLVSKLKSILEKI
ncbi:aminotransferase class III [Thermosipho melanesiensis]|uniref:Aminotransferase class-III n=2 Tax=Thermosipho melanesiensis TaxID=46541 RepID=A6LP62_THEM4|nr:aminotransferase class III-fold pyridoxal phosphate-dependent enzyme [Thermosipho melanesiensis]ABR31713.1 aminotransferase class-III [Thermosipho melanesiensis BI429]APT74736.1 aminotransferase class III [Thermosipho melanesiensis]OOC35237.1 aminotransferase class III [Thermosipho melanesiensis]OOC35447.1 aminotransferase class III [Thermosipho melanesiensis]OOC36698.1 aminotransferase class III [Thermosipho melanesiensis]